MMDRSGDWGTEVYGQIYEDIPNLVPVPVTLFESDTGQPRVIAANERLVVDSYAIQSAGAAGESRLWMSPTSTPIGPGFDVFRARLPGNAVVTLPLVRTPRRGVLGGQLWYMGRTGLTGVSVTGRITKS